MGTWGGSRPGAGRKKAAKLKLVSSSDTVPAEPKQPRSNLFDSRAAARIIAQSRELARARARSPEMNPFQLPQFPPRAVPPQKLRMAMDENLGWAGVQWAGAALGAIGGEGLLFLGYPYLSELAQRPEYRVISETIADDATRKWLDFEVTGDDEKAADEQKAKADKEAGASDKLPEAMMGAGPGGERQRKPMADPDERADKIKAAGKTDKVKALKDELVRLNARDEFYKLAVQDGFFGRSHLFIDTGVDIDSAGEDELRAPIGDGRDDVSRGKIGKGDLRGLRTIEAVWTYPTTYNAINPLRPDWYNPQVWYVMGKEIHASRLPVFIGHPVPDLLKPAYSFGGLSLSQMAKPYVDIWLKTRQSVGDLIHSFSVMVLMTDMQTILQPGGGAAGVLSRVDTFNALRDNMGTYVLNKATEDFKNVSASLSGLHELQAQAQEHMASVSRIPLVKLTGISPSGLNASSEGEIRAYYDTIAAYQNRFFRPNLTRIINFAQLSLWGEIDPEITFEFEPLWEMSQKEKSEKEKDDATRDQTYVDMGAFAPAEIRKIKIDDPTLPYAGLEPDDVPDLKEEEEEGLEPEGGRPDPNLTGPGPGGGGNGGGEGGGQDAAIIPFPASDVDPFAADDGEFKESDHPRAPDGKFGSGSGSSGGATDLTKQEKQAVNYYSGAGNYQINAALRGEETPTKETKQAILELESAIKKSSLDKAVTGFRMVSPAVRDALTKKIGGLIQDQGFMSVSDGGVIKEEGATTKIQVVLPKGAEALRLGDLSQFKDENEILVQHGAKFKVDTARNNSGDGPAHVLRLTLQVSERARQEPDPIDEESKPAFPMSKEKPEYAHAVVKRLIDDAKGLGMKPKQFVVDKIPADKLRATQGELKPFGEEGAEGEGDAPFPGFEDKPVILRSGGQYHVLDGHNRISALVRAGKPVSAYVFDDVDLDKSELDGIRKKTGANDSAFKEEDHDRAPDGKFGSGSGGGASSAAVAPQDGAKRTDGSEIPIHGKGPAVTAVKSYLATLPRSHLDKFSGSIKVSTEKIGDFAGDSEGVGLYDLHSRSITIAAGIKNQDQVVRHEMGHALDHSIKINGLPPSAVFRKAAMEDAARLTPKEAERAAYWLKSRSEVFAELYSLAYSPPESGAKFFGGMSRARASAVFAGALEQIKGGLP